MSRPVVIAANWKMHKTAADVGPWLAAFGRAAPRNGNGLALVVFPPHTILSAVAAAAGGRLEVGAQSCHWEPEGAWTGEVSAPQVRAAGASWTLVGHSERRQHFGETDETCAQKVRAALAAGLRPLLCVGETLAEREAGQQRAVVVRQLGRALEGLDRDGFGQLRVAYEPVWAIGTGLTAAPGDAQEMHAAIRAALAAVASPELARRIPILYGGSVKPDNAADLLAGADVDGALVGGASLDGASFAGIAAAAADRLTG